MSTIFLLKQGRRKLNTQELMNTSPVSLVHMDAASLVPMAKPWLEGMQSSRAGKPWRRAWEAADLTVPSIRKQGEMNSGAQPFLFWIQCLALRLGSISKWAIHTWWNLPVIQRWVSRCSAIGGDHPSHIPE